TLSGVPASIYAVTGGTAGVAVTYGMPTASDIVDPDPLVACAPGSGSVFPVGSTAVRCSATDASGNASTAQFWVSVGRLQANFGAWHLTRGSCYRVDAVDRGFVAGGFTLTVVP